MNKHRFAEIVVRPALGTLLGTALLAGAVLATTGAQAEESSIPAVPPCAWPEEVGAQAANVFYPDSAAGYWVMPYRVTSDLKITVQGTYPDARYASFNVYGDKRAPATTGESAITDFEIAPDPGATNPWRAAAAHGGRFTLTLRSDATPGQENTLPLAPPGTADGTTGYLVYRVYLPAGGDFSTVSLPKLAFTRNGRTRTLPVCDKASRVAAAQREAEEVSPSENPADTPDLTFVRESGSTGIFSNADAAYLSAWVTPPAEDQVVVVRGKAPKAATGEHPSPWPGRDDQLRYWSLCTNLRLPLRPVVVNELPNGEVDYGCRHDDATALGGDGSYAFVLGTEARRGEIEAVPGATFVPFSLEQASSRHLILLRNMVPVEGFAEAVQHVPSDGKAESAAKVMRDYYPEAKVCALSTLKAKGVSGCFA